MTRVFLILSVFMATATNVFAYKNSSGYEQDAYGRWERSDRTWKDSDGDGVVNKFDRNNRNSSIW